MGGLSIGEVGVVTGCQQGQQMGDNSVCVCVCLRVCLMERVPSAQQSETQRALVRVAGIVVVLMLA